MTGLLQTNNPAWPGALVAPHRLDRVRCAAELRRGST